MDWLEKILEKDGRYAGEAYVFVLSAITYTKEKLERDGHISARELLEGIRELGIKWYGRMTRFVFESWGVKSTEDFGEIVYNLIDAGLAAKSPADSKEDFRNIYSFDEAFGGME